MLSDLRPANDLQVELDRLSELPLELAGAENAAAAALRAIKTVGLEPRRGHYPHQLSGGMQRRLNIACGVLHGPRLVLLDEPTVGVDPQGRQRIWKMLDELRQSGAALIQSTHGINEIEPLCDRMLIMDHGRILAAGSVDELIAETLGAGAGFTLALTIMAGLRELRTVIGLDERVLGRLDPPREVRGRLAEAIGKVVRLQIDFRHARLHALHGDFHFADALDEVLATGVVPRGEVGPGEAVRIMTGGAFPKGADAVLMAEYATDRGDVVLAQGQVRA